MITIDDRFSIKKYTYGWELHDTTKSEDSKSKTGFTTRVSFHPNIKKICFAIIDRSAGDCKNVKKLISTIEKSTKKLSKKLKGVEDGKS